VAPLAVNSPALYRAGQVRATAGVGKARASTVMSHMSEQTNLEEQLAHLNRAVDDLSDIVARQEGEISRLTYRVQMLMEREAGRETDAGGSATMVDQRPPHY
jgi:SlyX protein